MSYIGAEMRRQVIERAGNCCEYCFLSQIDNFLPFEIDHIIAEKHNGKTQIDNLCLSCPNCNSFKGSDIGSIDEETDILTSLYNPRKQIWSQHFKLVDALIEPLSAHGRVTVFLLRLNRAEQIVERSALIDMGRYPCKKPD